MSDYARIDILERWKLTTSRVDLLLHLLQTTLQLGIVRVNFQALFVNVVGSIEISQSM